MPIKISRTLQQQKTIILDNHWSHTHMGLSGTKHTHGTLWYNHTHIRLCDTNHTHTHGTRWHQSLTQEKELTCWLTKVTILKLVTQLALAFVWTLCVHTGMRTDTSGKTFINIQAISLWIVCQLETSMARAERSLWRPVTNMFTSAIFMVTQVVLC